MRCIGIDVGGTNTDAVLIDDATVVRTVKRATTSDVTSGIQAAVQALGIGTDEPVDAVMIGTTHFLNAVIEQRGLSRVAAIRIGLPAGAALPPFTDWPAPLRDKVQGHVVMVRGGTEVDGREFVALDEPALVAAARAIRDKGIASAAISASFSPINTAMEERAAQILRAEYPALRITKSHEIGRVGLLERENSALLNASLADLARSTVAGFRAALHATGIEAPLFLTQNDGTIAHAERAVAFPIFSFASGATNSMRGAAFLSGIDDAFVIDVGGTTSDVGQLVGGFPRPANSFVEIAGVRTLFRMPDLFSIGLGGGSRIGLDPLSVGPQSVGYRLQEEARVFGGQTLTASDLAVAAGLADIGERDRVGYLSSSVLEDFEQWRRSHIESAIDRMKVRAQLLPLLAVGGGAFLVPRQLAGISEVVTVRHGDCANAVGAAIAQISGECDQVFAQCSREEAMQQAMRLATERAVEAGADPAALQVVETEDLPLQYLPGSRRVRVLVVGQMKSISATSSRGMAHAS